MGKVEKKNSIFITYKKNSKYCVIFNNRQFYVLKLKCTDFVVMLYLVTTKLNSASNRQCPTESSPTPSPASPPEDNVNKQPTTT